jgi:serine phosphatase RsbU (regulator of sigma subunit)/TPR repeat protein
MSLFNNLSTLETAGLIQVAKVEPDLEYLFSHSMVQDAAYASLLESDRKRLHLAVGEAIESLYPDRTNELAAILGYHFKEAGEDHRALHYFLIAGDESLSVYANQEAEIQYRSALELSCCSEPQIALLYAGLAEALYRQNRFAESVEAYFDGINVFKSLGDDEGVARLYARLARVEWYAGHRPESLRICLQGLDLVKDTPDSLGKATLIHETARAYYFNGNSEKALPLCRQALALEEKLGAVPEQADALATLGILAGVQPEESLEALRKAVELAEANGLLNVAMRAHINLGTMTRAWQADNETALQHFRRAAELGKLRGVASEEVLGLSSYIACLFTPGRLNEIDAELPGLEALIQQIPNPASMMTTLKFIKAVLISFRGDWDSAISQIGQCLQKYREEKNQESEISMLDELSWLILEKNRWGEPTDLGIVDTLLQEALMIVEKANSNERQWVYSRIAILKARQGRLAEAQEWLEKNRQGIATRYSVWDDRLIGEGEVEIFIARQNWNDAILTTEKITREEQRLGFRVHAAVSLVCWADLLIKRGNSDDLENALTFLSQAMAEFNEMGIGHYPVIAQELLKKIQASQRAQTVQNVQMTSELRKARKVQESLLPANPPQLPGWDVAVLLEPAHETSGDFYDFLTLPDGNLGMVIADVTDKGTSAALFMALSRSLWRTFAINHPAAPELTMADTNQRIVADTHGGLYITLLYGILNPNQGDFTYCSAGHHPALLLRASDGSVEKLEHTGIPLGVMEESSWKRETVKIDPGDALVLYTDGITDAENPFEEFYGLERLQEALSRQRGKKAEEIRDALRDEVRRFVGKAAQFDDITLLVLVRDMG